MSGKTKMDCQVCGQDVFGKSVVHVQGCRRSVITTGWCRQCGNGVQLVEIYMAGDCVGRVASVLPPKKKARRARP